MASALAWSLYLLCKHRDAYMRAQAEADSLTGDTVGFADLAKLPFCLMVFKEALRMYPPVYAFGRQALEPTELGGYEIPFGVIVLVSPYALHRRADVWPDPDRFDPTFPSARGPGPASATTSR